MEVWDQVKFCQFADGSGSRNSKSVWIHMRIKILTLLAGSGKAYVARVSSPIALVQARKEHYTVFLVAGCGTRRLANICGNVL